MDKFLNNDSYSKYDPEDMYGSINKFPSQIDDGISIVNNSNIEAFDISGINNIVLLGMGGSAIGGDLVRALTEMELKLPFLVNRSYDIPGFVDESTLVITSSYSGNTEETLSALEKCIARKSKIICISTNGKLEEIASDNKFPLLLLPKGFQPRAALGLSFSVVLMIFESLGLIDNIEKDLLEAKSIMDQGLETFSKDLNFDNNSAKQIAKNLHGKLPVIYTASKTWNSVGVRIRGQIEENAKTLAYSNEFPEMNHNEIVGYGKIEHMQGKLIALFIEDNEINERVKFRMKFTKDLLEKSGVETITIEGQGQSLLARVLSVIQIGDFVSYYLAMLNQVDPMPVKVIQQLKEQLKSIVD